MKNIYSNIDKVFGNLKNISMLPDFLFSIQLLDAFIRNMLKILNLKSKSV